MAWFKAVWACSLREEIRSTCERQWAALGPGMGRPLGLTSGLGARGPSHLLLVVPVPLLLLVLELLPLLLEAALHL
jgi:hypothetical protein